MKRLRKLFLATCLLLSTTCVAFSGCSIFQKPQEPTNQVTQPNKDGYLALNEYAIDLLVGETFDLKVFKIENGKSAKIEKMTVKSEAEKIVVAEGSKLTAMQPGETYVQIKADGYSISCFVSVSNPVAGTESVIRVNEGKLYNNVSVQAYAYLFESGKLVAGGENVVWEIVGDGTITSEGIVTPTATQTSLTLKATFSVDGKEYKAEQTFEVAKAIYYAPTKTSLRIAGPKTLSGAENKKGRIAEFSVKAVDIITQEESSIEGLEISCKSSDENLLQITKKAGEENVFQITSKGVGSASAGLTVGNEYISIACEAANPIASIRDMDLLSLASLNNTSLLSQSYILVNDLDYNGEVILPIAAFGRDATTKRAAGYQWKHWLTKTSDSYNVVERGNQGKEGTLTEAQFRAFSAAKGINPSEKSFDGVFDGNGYSIKNGLIFYGSMINPSAGSGKAVGYADGVFGKVSGTICNVSFENLKMQNPADFTATTGPYDITPVLISHLADLGGSGINYPDGELGKTDEGKYYLRGGALVARTMGATIENVYAEIAYDGFIKDSGYVNGGLILWESDDSKVSNNAVWITGEGISDWGGGNFFTLQGQGSTSANVYCNLTIGGRGLQSWSGGSRKVGDNGNFWKEVGDWRTLSMVAPESGVENRMTYEQSVATFDTSVWTFEDFKPTLLKNCSGNIDLA